MASPIGILGATSVVAEYLTELLAPHYQPLLFSRSILECQNMAFADGRLPFWISTIPTWATPNYFDLFLARSAHNSRFFYEPFHKDGVSDRE
jgi:hypothetical protein